MRRELRQTTLRPYPILMKRVKGLAVEHAFFQSDDGEDIAYRWDVWPLPCNGISSSFTVALYEALEHCLQQMISDIQSGKVTLQNLSESIRLGMEGKYNWNIYLGKFEMRDE